MSSKRHYISALRRSEQGMVAIMTAMVLIMVISLIVLGFSQISRRNQRASLDRQLSTQAFYAAESGVNDVRKIIQDRAAAGQPIPDKTGCTDSAGGVYSVSPDIDTANSVKYSCLLVDPSPSELTYGTLGQKSVVIPLNSTGPNIEQVVLSWEPKSGSNVLPGCPTSATNVFSPAGTWTCGYGVVRFDLVPTAGAGLTIDSLRDATMTTFVVPQRSGAGASTIGYAPHATNTNVAKGINCTDTLCTLTITGLSSANYYMRASSLYKDVGNFKVMPRDGAGNAIPTTGAQAIIDSTGRAQDVLRRIKVNIPIQADSQNQLSDFAIQTTDSICKRYSIISGLLNRDSLGVTGTSRLCGTGSL